MNAITAELGHSFASTRLYDGASGAQVTISLSIGQVLTLEDAQQIRANLSALLAAGFSVNAPGLEAGEEREAVGAISRREKSDGTPILDLFAPSAALVYKLITIYLDEQTQIDAFEKATGLTLKEIPLNDGDVAVTRDSKNAAKYIVNVKRPATAILKANPKYDPNEQEAAKKKPARLFVTWEDVPVLELVPKAESPAPNSSALPTSTTGSGAPSTSTGWISPATWVKSREEWDTFLKAALDKFGMDADAVDTALRKLATCDKPNIGDWHKSKDWARAAIIAAAKKYDASAIDAYTSTMPGDAKNNMQLDQMAKLITWNCTPKDEPEDTFTREFGGGADPTGRAAIAAELRNEEVTITRIEKDLTKRGHDLWIGFAPMEDSSEPLRITLYPEDVTSIKAAGYILAWPKTSGQSVAVEIPVITYQNKTSGRRIESVQASTMPLGTSESA